MPVAYGVAAPPPRARIVPRRRRDRGDPLFGATLPGLVGGESCVADLRVAVGAQVHMHAFVLLARIWEHLKPLALTVKLLVSDGGDMRMSTMIAPRMARLFGVWPKSWSAGSVLCSPMLRSRSQVHRLRRYAAAFRPRGLAPELERAASDVGQWTGTTLGMLCSALCLSTPSSRAPDGGARHGLLAVM